MVQTLPGLWLWDLRGMMQDDHWRSLLPELPAARQKKALSCRNPIDAARSACAGFLLQRALDDFGVPASFQVFRENAYGKPCLPAGPAFSITHAGHFAACAIGASPVGVDIEQPRITEAIAERCFHPEEVRHLHALSPAQLPDALLRLWTAKEAYTKYLGRGLTVPLSSFCVRLTAAEAKLDLPQKTAPLLHEYLLDGYRLCLCADAPRPELTYFSI